jgi:uncharacterized protein (TIGR02118 family)
MHKTIILLMRRTDLSHEEFVSWWLDSHAPLARQLPGLRKAVFNVIDQPGDGQPDGVSELWFDSIDDFTAAYESEIGKAVVADSLANVSSRQRFFVEENRIL